MINVIFFLNGDKGKYILNNIYKLKNINIKNIIVCRKKLIYEEKKNYLKKKYIFLKKINDNKNISILKKLKPDLFIIGGFPQILKKKIFQIPRLMTINLHGGPLPSYRGGSPLNWQIINMEKNIGISIIKINQGIDTGPIIAEAKFSFKKYDDIATTHKKVNKLFVKLLKKIFTKLLKGKIKFKQQTNINKKYWYQRHHQDNFLNLKKNSAQKAIYFVKALTSPYPGAWVNLKNKIKLRIFELKIYKKNFLKKRGQIKIIKNKIFLRTKDKTCRVLRYKYER